MDKSYIQAQLDQGKSTYDIAKDSGVCYSTVRYWLKKHGMGTVHSHTKKGTELECTLCGRKYKYDKVKGHSKSKCNSCLANANRQAKKQKAIDYK